VIPRRARDNQGMVAWLGVAPFFIFAVLFLVLPTLDLVIGAFRDPSGHFTLENIFRLFENRTILSAYWISIKVSVASAVLGAAFGTALSLAIVLGKLPAWIKPALLTFSGVASNFAGVALAFAFLSTLGRVGLVTALLSQYLGISIYAHGFNLLSFMGLTLVYLYFQIPLMVLIITPAVEGLKKEWREAAEILGGNGWHYWRHVALPILWPSILGTSLLLFANSFGAIATAYALAGSAFNIITIVLYAQIQGDVLHDQNLGFAMAFGMIVITGISNGLYLFLRARSDRWLR
jgi:putative spermidine/putrescine transport system permease protein